VIGQEEAVKAVSRAIRRARRAEGSQAAHRLLHLPRSHGVGKTDWPGLAEALFGDEDAMIRIDMSEYMERTPWRPGGRASGIRGL
jgi:ATP-dependent Clp protease ATP-binding subunit ClpA